MKNLLIWIAILALAAAGMGYYLQQQKHIKQTSATTVQEKPLALPESAPEPAINYPVPQEDKTQSAKGTGDAESPDATVPKPPLPALSDSDQPLLNDLGELFDPKKYQDQFFFKEIIQRFVVTVNNLTTTNLSRKYLLVRPVKGKFAVTKDAQGEVVLDPNNFARYGIYVSLLESIDIEQLVALYVRYYPLFQQAYESLGYPGKYFNDRVIEVIDNLLDAPVVQGEIKLKQPKVFYEFADPALESLSAGQKIMVRMGTDNAERIKVVLRNIRLELIR